MQPRRAHRLPPPWSRALAALACALAALSGPTHAQPPAAGPTPLAITPDPLSAGTHAGLLRLPPPASP